MRAIRPREEAGFSLPELLVVTVLIGILAALALPEFLGQKSKGSDAATKSDVRNLVSLVSACGAERRDYRHCDAAAELDNPGYDFGIGPGEVNVSASADAFEVTGVSKARSAGVNHRFTWQRDADGNTTRACFAGPGNSDGGCNSGNW